MGPPLFRETTKCCLKIGNGGTWNFRDMCSHTAQRICVFEAEGPEKELELKVNLAWRPRTLS